MLVFIVFMELFGFIEIIQTFILDMFSPMTYIWYILYNNTNSSHGGHLRWLTADKSPITLPSHVMRLGLTTMCGMAYLKKWTFESKHHCEHQR